MQENYGPLYPYKRRY